MHRLLYTFEKIDPAARATADEPIVGDVIVGIAMAAVGIVGMHRRVEGPAHAPQAFVSFLDERSLQRFNLRIERALDARGVKIARIRVIDGAAPTADERRAVA